MGGWRLGALTVRNTNGRIDAFVKILLAHVEAILKSSMCGWLCHDLVEKVISQVITVHSLHSFVKPAFLSNSPNPPL